jgi:hypothetical protein
LTNLVASGYLDAILQTLPLVYISQDMYEQQQLFLDDYDLEDQDISILKPIKKRITANMFPRRLSIMPLPPGELLQVIDFALVLGGDSEGYTAALACHHHWAVGVDTPKTAALFARYTPQLPIISTPAFIQHWIDNVSPSAHEVAQAIKNIYWRTHYLPPPTHALSSWWKKYLDL